MTQRSRYKFTSARSPSECRRVRARITTGELVAKCQFWELKERGFCHYCRRFGQRSQIEHVIPVVRGGDHDWENIVLACTWCNGSKGALFLLEWVITLGADPRELIERDGKRKPPAPKS